jgi:hypothetical protein
VYDIRKPYIQADVMLEEIEATEKDEYTFESLPLLLHQVNVKNNYQAIIQLNSHFILKSYVISSLQTSLVGVFKQSMLICCVGKNLANIQKLLSKCIRTLKID